MVLTMRGPCGFYNFEEYHSTKPWYLPMLWIYCLLQVVVLVGQANLVDAVCQANTPCYPSPKDLAKISNATLSVNSTCGSPPEAFCAQLDCNLICNASSPTDRHPKEYLYDSYDLQTYWKSKNFEEPVFIQLDIGQRIILHQIVVTFFFELPEGVYFLRSQDYGRNFYILVYYARECRIFGRTESSKYNGTQVLCFRIDPQVSMKQITYAPRRDESIAKEVLSGNGVRDYFITTNVRVVLHQYYKPADFNRATADQRKFYFALRDLDIQGSCFCNGMAETCDERAFGKCRCQKNTAGDNCERCLPLYNNKPWTFGQACQVCNCNNHSSSCVYNAVKRRGVCNNCIDNTAGDHCELCRAGYYRNTNVSLNDSSTCLSCGCNLAGASLEKGICSSVNATCYCKSNVTGTKCDICKDGFFGLSLNLSFGCQDCQCFPPGTVGSSNLCAKDTGQCRCAIGFTGRRCSICQSGFIGNSLLNPTTCSPCFCDPSGSINASCTVSGACFCKQNFFGLKCQNANAGYFAGSVQQFVYSVWSAMVISRIRYYSNYTSMLDRRGRSVYLSGYWLGLDTTSGSSTMMTFIVSLNSTTVYELVLRYWTAFSFSNVNMTITRQSVFQPYTCQHSNGRISVSENSRIFLASNLNAHNQSTSFGTSCLSTGTYSVTISFGPNSAGSLSQQAKVLITSLLILPSYSSAPLFISGNATLQSQIRYYYFLSWSSISWSFYGQQGARYLAFVLGPLFSTALPCQCNTVGSNRVNVCSFYGGQCECKANIIDKTCSRCLPNFYNFSSGNGCNACDCHPTGSRNISCNPITGVCPCHSFVRGRQCNTCIANYHGILSGAGCRPCQCSQVYSAHGQCRENGTCVCKPGIGGEKCTKCSTGYFRLTTSGCQNCNCSPVGRLNNNCNNITGVCQCKDNVLGNQCNTCKSGYFGFSALFPNACLRCQCSGVTSNCTNASEFSIGNVSTVFRTSENNVNVQGWRSVNQAGQTMGDIKWDWAPENSIRRGYAKLTDTPGSNAELFFVAPAPFLGNKRTAYMLFLSFEMTQQNASQPLQSTMGDVILKSSQTPYTLVHSLPSAPSVGNGFKMYEVQFYERLWRKNSTTGPVSTDHEIMKVLSSLSAIWIRGRWSQIPGQFVGLANVYLQYSTQNASGPQVTNVERCSCPREYSGQFCQECAPSFTRERPGSTSSSRCVLCSCNRHASICNTSTGICLNCRHNTTGNHCESCAAGFYGNATRGTPTDCSPCQCPGGPFALNQFSRVCVLASDGKPNCTECRTGYQGRHCERCADGYYGNPLHTNGECRRCECNRNVDVRATGNCNGTTGECLKCLYNTTGFQCQWCQSGFYGNALERSCKTCRCNMLGSRSSLCNNVTGQCTCMNNVVGLFCDRCANNTYNISSGNGCQLCNCNTFGSASLQCNEATGKCQCKPNVIGDKCDTCAPGYYDVSKGCLPCRCSTNYTVENSTCNQQTGQCVCKSSRRGGSYGGRQCDQCGPNAIGKPPDCALCHYPCYDNWQAYVTREEAVLQGIVRNSTNLLAQFQGLTYQEVRLQIDYMSSNLTYAGTVFQGAQFDTKTKEAQFKQIETVIIQYEASLNKSKANLETARDYFASSASSFNGTVTLSSIPKSPLPYPFQRVRVRRAITPLTGSVTPVLLSTFAQQFVTTSQSNNASGYVIFSTISSSYNQILAANKSVVDSANEVAQSVLRLSEAATARTTASNYLDQSFNAQMQANAADLNRINTMLVALESLVNQTELTQSQALLRLSSAQSVVAEAETKANLLKTSANGNARLASQMYISASALKADAESKQAAARNLKINADTVQYDASLATAAALESINQAAAVRNRTILTTETAQRVTNTTIPVSLSRIQALSNQIVSTSVDEAQINQTYAGAAEGLKKAQDVQRLSRQAVNVSQSTLDDIRIIEASLRNTSMLQNETRQMIANNDMKIKNVINISNTVENEMNKLQTATTLSQINSTIKEVDANMMCFVNAKSAIDNATLVAQEAQNLSTEAVKVHETNSRTLRQYSTQIEARYTQSLKHYEDARKLNQSARQLLNDVNEAEMLLRKFMAQKMELDNLKNETASLERELDQLVSSFMEVEAKLKTCKRK